MHNRRVLWRVWAVVRACIATHPALLTAETANRLYAAIRYGLELVHTMVVGTHQRTRPTVCQ